MVCHLHLLLHCAPDVVQAPVWANSTMLEITSLLYGRQWWFVQSTNLLVTSKKLPNIFPGRHHIQLGHGQLHAQLLEESLKNVK